MTIYSQYADGGTVQILVTYRGAAGVTSSTVTTLTEATLAPPIVDALNRISALATVPVSVYDRRGGGVGDYPRTHLAALTDRGARADLLEGAHSLWYEHVKLLLHQALADLDDALVGVPAPVRAALEAELETEARQLRDALTEYSHGAWPPGTGSRRYWEFESPFVAFNKGLDALNRDNRERFDHLENGISIEQRENAVDDLRTLVTAFAHYRGDHAWLEPADFAIFDDPYGPPGHYLRVGAPRPGDEDGAWCIEIGRWVPDDPQDVENGSATTHAILTCLRSRPPAVSEIADLLNRSAQQPGRLAAWAQTPLDTALPETTFIVTQRYDL